MYSYVSLPLCRCISANALRAFGVTRLSNLLSDFCYPVLSAFLFNRPPLLRTGTSWIRTAGSRPPQWALSKIIIVATCHCQYSLFHSLDPSYNSSKSQLLVYFPPNIHFFTFLQKHRILNFNENNAKRKSIVVEQNKDFH